MQLAEIKERRVQLTVRGGVVVAGAHEAPRGQPRHQLARVALVDALTLGQCIQLVKHLKETRTRLMDGAHDGAPSAAQVFQQLDALVAWWAVQATTKILISITLNGLKKSVKILLSMFLIGDLNF